MAPAVSEEVKSAEIVKDPVFKRMKEVRVDPQGRVPIGRTQVMGPNGGVTIYRLYQNSFGQIILDPQVIVPAHEVWLLKNPKAMKMVIEGWEDAKQGRLVDAREDYTKYVNDP